MNSFQAIYRINRVFNFFLTVTNLQREDSVLFILQSIHGVHEVSSEWHFFYLFISSFVHFIDESLEFNNITAQMDLNVIINILTLWNQLCLDEQIFHFCQDFFCFSRGEILYVELANKYGNNCFDFIFLNSFSGLDWCGSICTACCKLETCDQVRNIINILFSVWYFSQDNIHYFKQIQELCLILNYPQIHEEFIINLCKSIIKKNRGLK